MRYYTDIVCESCGFKYYLPTTSRRRLDLLLRFAICPNCNRPRTPEGDPMKPHCKVCCLPASVIRIISSAGLCIACYYDMRRNRKRAAARLQQ